MSSAPLLTIDIGNTSLTLGLFAGEALSAHWELATGARRTSDEFGLQILGLLQRGHIAAEALAGVCLCSVVPALSEIVSTACAEYLGQVPFVLSSDSKTGLINRYETPETLGMDRIADVAAVYHLYGGPAIVIDFGTATTFNALSGNAEFLGGAIAPGLAVASEALFQRTNRLPRVNPQLPPSVIGRNTAHAMQSGLLFGYVSLVEGMIERFKAELGPDTRVVATGGLAQIISHQTAKIDVHSPWLTLEGLRILWALNRGAAK